MPGVNGLELAEKIHESNPAILVIIFSGQTDMASVISAINKGHVYKFLVKSWIREDIRSAILQALSQYELMDSNRKLTATVEAQNKRACRN
jgi:DNA-binding NtrC family response regulator